MAVYKVIHQPKKYHDSNAFHDLTQYATAVSKGSSDNVVCGAVLPEIAAESMRGVTKAYHKDKGTRLRHSVLSFSPNDPLTARQVKEITKKCVAYYEDNYQILAAVHEDCDHLHIHFVMNTTSYVDGSKYRGTKSDYYGFIKHMKQVLRPYGLTAKPEKDKHTEK